MAENSWCPSQPLSFWDVFARMLHPTSQARQPGNQLDSLRFSSKELCASCGRDQYHEQGMTRDVKARVVIERTTPFGASQGFHIGLTAL